MLNFKLLKSISVLFFLIIFTNYSLAESKIDKAVEQKAGLEIPTGCLTGSCGACEIDVNGETIRACISHIESYKRYKDGKFISEDGWRFTKLGALRLFNGDVKLTWKIKIGKENLMVIKTKFQPIGKEYPFTYKLKKLFFEEIQ